jgi:hypothetical protein
LEVLFSFEVLELRVPLCSKGFFSKECISSSDITGFIKRNRFNFFAKLQKNGTILPFCQSLILKEDFKLKPKLGEIKGTLMRKFIHQKAVNPSRYNSENKHDSDG